MVKDSFWAMAGKLPLGALVPFESTVKEDNHKYQTMGTNNLNECEFSEPMFTGENEIKKGEVSLSGLLPIQCNQSYDN